MPYTSDKLKQFERLGTDAINGDTESADGFVRLAFAELNRMAGVQEKLAAKAVSLMVHVPENVQVGELRDTAAAFKFWRASQSSDFWKCPCGCKSFYPIERTVCPVSGDVRAQDLTKVKWI